MARLRAFLVLAIVAGSLVLTGCHSAKANCSDPWGSYEACNLLDGPCDCR